MDREMLGRFIAQRRKERNMTQRELAEKLHVTDKAVSKWERGAGCPDISLLEPLAEALELSVDQLLTYQTAPAVPEPAEEPVTSQAVQAVLDLTLAERRARRMRRWIVGLAVPLALIVLTVLYTLLQAAQIRGRLFINKSSTSPDGNITVVTYTSGFGEQTVKVKEPNIPPRDRKSGEILSDTLSLGYPNTKITGLYWSPDSAYLAFGQKYTGSEPHLDCTIWHFYQDESGQWHGGGGRASLRNHLEHLWYEGNEVLKDAFPAVQTVPANGYPIFDVTIDGWDGTVLQVICTYTGTDNEEHQVTVCYDAASRQVVSAE